MTSYSALYLVDNFKITKKISLNLRPRDFCFMGGLIVVIRNNGEVYIYGDKETYTIPEFRAKKCSGSNNHILLIDEDDQVWTFGNNINGKLGVGELSGKIMTPTKLGIKAKQIIATNNNSIILGIDGQIYISGRYIYDINKYINYKNYKKISQHRFVKIAAGHDFLLALDSAGVVHSAGDNFYDQLATGDQIDRWDLRPAPLLNKVQVRDIACGFDHSLILTVGGNVLVFGNGPNKNNTKALSIDAGGFLSWIDDGRYSIIEACDYELDNLDEKKITFNSGEVMRVSFCSVRGTFKALIEQ